MRAQVLVRPGAPLVERERHRPEPASGDVLVRVAACGVCRTDLHVADGELEDPALPLILGHEIVGCVERVGEGGGNRFRRGDRVGIPWLAWACGECPFCRSGRENLCEQALFTGYTVDGGYAEETVVDARFAFPIPESYGDAEAAHLLCAGLIGYRTLRKAGDARRIGIYGFGAAAHIVAQVARFEGRRVFAFTRPGDLEAQAFAKSLGAEWAGGSDEAAPEPLDAALLFAPAGELVPRALAAVEPGGTVVCGGIHMSDIPAFAYELLWGERTVTSVANLTRRDAEQFLALAGRAPIRTRVSTYPLDRANDALAVLRSGRLTGAAVLTVP
jgi:propanol-preferring alcohol dehydrogenase